MICIKIRHRVHKYVKNLDRGCGIIVINKWLMKSQWILRQSKGTIEPLIPAIDLKRLFTYLN